MIFLLLKEFKQYYFGLCITSAHSRTTRSPWNQMKNRRITYEKEKL
jgi:hypothetical protein